jgi:hypothetical protein
MYVLNQVDAVHDVAKRIIKSNLKPVEVVDLITELKKAGYEEKNINIKITHTVYEEGDEIEITKEIFDALPTNEYIEDNWKQVSPKERKQNEARKTINYIFGPKPNFPVKGTLSTLRLNNEHGQMIVKWKNPINNGWKETNCYFLGQMGFNIPEPEFKYIPIKDSDDDLLSEYDLIIKYMMIQNNWTEKQVDEYLKPVNEAMNKAEAVFYRP